MTNIQPLSICISLTASLPFLLFNTSLGAGGGGGEWGGGGAEMSSVLLPGSIHSVQTPGV